MPTSTPTSTELLAILAERRDAPAWAELLDRHGAAMHRSAMAVTSNADHADDAVQEALLHLRQRAGRFRNAPAGVDPEDAVRHWLQRLAANAALHLLRAERRRRNRERQASPPTVLAEEPAMPPPCEPAQISAALARLSEGDRRTILLRHIEGLDGSDLAAALGCGAGAARVRLHRAMERLRGHLARAGIALTLAAMSSRLDAAVAVWSQAPTAAARTAWAGLLATPRIPRLAFHLLNGTPSPMTIAVCAASIPLLAAALLTAHLTSAEPRPPSIPAPKPVSAPAVQPAPRPNLEVRLQQVVTVDFQDTALSDAVAVLRRLSDVDIVITPADLQTLGNPAVSLKVETMALANVLRFIERLNGLDHRISGEQYILVPKR